MIVHSRPEPRHVFLSLPFGFVIFADGIRASPPARTMNIPPHASGFSSINNRPGAAKMNFFKRHPCAGLSIMMPTR